MLNKPYISFCIPTFNRLEILQKTIESIYADKEVDLDDFEVVISDNEPNQSAREIIEKFSYKNLYYHPTNTTGFLNSFNVLKFGNGHFLKLHNNYTMLKRNSLKEMIEEVKRNLNSKPVIFYTDGLKQYNAIRKYDSYDKFMRALSYFSSWSTGFGIWKDDFNKVEGAIKINEYFPQTSLLVTQSDKVDFIINDLNVFDNQHIPKKGGYNIFKVFAVDFVSLIKGEYDAGKISRETFDKIKSDLLLNYIAVRYFKTVIARLDNFEKSDIKKSIGVYYSPSYYYLMILTSFFSPLKHLKRKFNS